ncbi:hypothetical protein [Pseudohongiella spirulinae]|uniref:hypothetical protein n=1 Tax=Pseudohongiella spirulinae TaxID=1249552 RepID=UPI0007179083|nr:hypothetical protein [Pseudohongiella spirulinae]
MQKLAAITALLIALIGCSVIQQASVPESIAVGYLSIEAIAETAADADLDEPAKDRVRSALQEAKDILDSATDLYEAGFEAQAESALARASQLLATAQEILTRGRN